MMEKIGILKLITLYKYTDKPAISRAVLRYRLDMYQCLKNRISMKYKKILKLNNGLISDVLLKFMTKIYSVDIYSKILKESDFVDESICTLFCALYLCWFCYNCSKQTSNNFQNFQRKSNLQS